MAGFADIIGHGQIISHLKTAIATDRVSHAYILNGPDHSGKRLLADAFAMTLQCETLDKELHGAVSEQMSLFDLPGMTEPEVSDAAMARVKRTEACGECHSCRQALGKNQPDIIYVTHKKTVLSVDDVREQINSSVVVRPYSSRYKVYIVDEAERMNVQAQNALLKTVEEPPEYVVILLLTTNADSFLPTILSRCVRLDLKPVDDSLIRSFLMRQHAVPDYRADLCVAFAQGNVGRAVMLASSNEFGEIKEATVSLIRKLDRLPLCDATAELAPITASKDDISTFLDLVLLLFRDVLLYKSTGAAEKLVFKDEEELVSDLALKIPFSGLNGILEAINKANLRISMNVNASMTLEMLLINIKENL